MIDLKEKERPALNQQDISSEELANLIVKGMQERKGQNIVMMDLLILQN